MTIASVQPYHPFLFRFSAISIECVSVCGFSGSGAEGVGVCVGDVVVEVEGRSVMAAHVTDVAHFIHMGTMTSLLCTVCACLTM